jgi:glycosyl transferase family 2
MTAPSQIRVTIVTPTTDQSRYVDEAIASVARDEGVVIEHIVVHDGSTAFADALRRRYPDLTVITGPDAGPGPAVAAAFAAARGDFILELNSDDRLVAGCLRELSRRASVRPDIAIWTGGLTLFRVGADGNEITVREAFSREATELSLPNLLDDLPLLNARFFRRSVLRQIGNLDPRYARSSDREFLIRAALAGIPEAALGVPVQEMREHDESLTLNRFRGRVPVYIAEHIALADRLLAGGELTPSLKQIFRNWRAREILRLGVLQWRAGETDAARRTVWRALCGDPLWWARAASAAAAWRRRRR